jgi:hypothetical protein
MLILEVTFLVKCVQILTQQKAILVVLSLN